MNFNGNWLLFVENVLRKDYRLGEFSLRRLRKGTLKIIQTEKLRRILVYLQNNSDFYSEQFKANKIDINNIRGLGDVVNLPFTTPQDIVNFSGEFLCKGNLPYHFLSTGAFGKPKNVFFSREDLEKHFNSIMIGFRYLMERDDVAQILFDPEKDGWNTGYLLSKALGRMGIKAIITGNRLEPKEQMDIMEKNNATVLFATASYINRITKELGKHDLTEIGIKKIILGAEPWQEKLRGSIKKRWNCDVYDAYGMAELGFAFAIECKHHKGLHYNNSDFLVEVVDPKTGKRSDEGEFVFTTLSRRGMPLLRYKSGDLGSLIRDECECGLKTERISRIKGRIDDMVTIGTGENFYLSSFEEIFYGMEEVLDYNVIVTKNGYKDLIVVNVAAKRKEESLRKKILNNILNIGSIRYDVDVTKTIAMPVITFSDGIINTGNKA